jgi:dolichyl-phosphate beta-glucosyltransferase
VRAAQSDFIFYMDADLSVPLWEVPVFLDYFRSHPEIDLLFGNRQHPSSRITRRQSRLRQKLGQSFNAVLRAMALAQVRDTQCGFKAFRREAAHRIFAAQQLDGFAFDIEVLLLAQRLGHRIAGLPVEWINSEESKVRLVRDSARMLWDAVRIRRMLDTSELPPRKGET